MEEQEKFEAFMQRVLQRLLPNNPMARVRTFVKELAEGATENLWKPAFSRYSFQEPELKKRTNASGEEETYYSPKITNVTNYIEKRWGFDNIPNLQLLVANEYFHQIEEEGGLFGHTYSFVLTRLAFDLLHEVEASTVFISYKRSESSAFALLINTQLKTESINSYLDMAIPVGDDWQKRIKDEIEKHDYFVFLIGKQSLSSDVVRQEITWAMQFGKVIIPIWHNGYEYKSGEFPLLPEADEVLKKTNAIRVLEESALAYNNAIVELLNRFGVTP